MSLVLGKEIKDRESNDDFNDFKRRQKSAGPQVSSSINKLLDFSKLFFTH